VITSWTAPDIHKFVAIGSGVSAPQVRDFSVHLGVTMFFLRFLGSSIRLQPYTLERIFTQNTSNDVVPGKEVRFGGLGNHI